MPAKSAWPCGGFPKASCQKSAGCPEYKKPIRPTNDKGKSAGCPEYKKPITDDKGKSAGPEGTTYLNPAGSFLVLNPI